MSIKIHLAASLGKFQPDFRDRASLPIFKTGSWNNWRISWAVVVVSSDVGLVVGVRVSVVVGGTQLERAVLAGDFSDTGRMATIFDPAWQYCLHTVHTVAMQLICLPPKV